MNPELWRLLGECQSAVDRLLVLMEGEKLDMENCIRGELLETYRKAVEQAEERAEALRMSLIVLQLEQKLGL